jgi:hypothetical protein
MYIAKIYIESTVRGRSMGKYEPLTHYLENQSEETWDASFSDVERILGFALPRSAHDYAAWWANQEPGHSQTRGWREAGWDTGQVDLAAKKVRFSRRRRDSSTGTSNTKARGPHAELWDKARRLSGIEDRDALITAALTALIRREAAKQLIAMGGTMPDFTVPARERATW